MISGQLQRARSFEEKYIKEISPEERPAYHLTAGVGWLNDPNGFSFYKGKYHIFYQYHPYSNEWGPMHWGHVVSSDLLTWERLPVSMAPDEEYDKDGCFSGSALELADGRHLLMYTGVQSVQGTDGKTKTFQTQCMAVGDGINYTKYAGNPVISAKDLPDGGLAGDFRDPKMWQEEDGTFYSVIADMQENGEGQILLYKSPDALHWEYCSTLDSSQGKLGKMWECPDFFPLDGKHVLIVSPMAMHPDGEQFHVGHNVAGLVGTFDKATGQFTREHVQQMDWGIDFYAPQSTCTPDGRQVMIGWMQDWSNSKFTPPGVKYFGQLTVPRELSIRNGKIIQKPVRELESYRGKQIRHEHVAVSEEMSLEGIRGRVLDMTVDIHTEEDFRKLCMKFACNEEYFTSLSYDPKSEMLRLDRSFSGYLYDIVHSRDIPVKAENGRLKLRILLDRYSMEVFINDGEKVASLTIYTPLDAEEIRFSAEGNAVIDIEKYELIF